MLHFIAQTTQPFVDPGPDIWQLGSVSAIAIMTMAIVQYVLKPALAGTKLGALPTQVYLIAVASLLIVLANKGLKTLPGDNLILLIWNGIYASLAASGLYNVLPVGSSPAALTPLNKTAQSGSGAGPTGTAVLLICLLTAAALASSGCAGLKSIPIFNPQARLLNRVASGEELLIEVNGEVAQLRDDGFLTQAEIDRSITPRLNQAKAIIMATRAVARGTTRPTTAPAGSIDDAKALLLEVRAILTQIRGQS